MLKMTVRLYFSLSEAVDRELKLNKMDGIFTLCVCPYVIDTGLFSGCKIRLEP